MCLSTDPFFSTFELNNRSCIGLVVKTACLQLVLLPAFCMRQWEACYSCVLAELDKALQIALGNGLICPGCSEFPQYRRLLEVRRLVVQAAFEWDYLTLKCVSLITMGVCKIIFLKLPSRLVALGHLMGTWLMSVKTTCWWWLLKYLYLQCAFLTSGAMGRQGVNRGRSKTGEAQKCYY